MKKLVKLLLAMCTVLALVACSNTGDGFQEIDITATELKEKIDNDESFVFIVERDNCNFCEAIQEYIEETKAEHPGVTLYKLDATDFELMKETEDSDTLISTSEDGNTLLDIAPYFLYTPTIYVVENGEVVDSGIGFSTTNKTVSQWGLDSAIDFDQAETVDFWEFISR